MIIAALVVLALFALGWLALWLSPAHRVAFTDVLNADPAAAATTGRSVTIIAPARNEAAVLPASVPTYCNQSYAASAVVIADDQSDDTTPQVLQQLATEHANLRTLRTEPRPAGWVGKNWAVASAVGSIGPGQPDDILVFTDSDCLFHLHAVATVVARMEARQLDLLSVLPRMEFTIPAERIGLPGLLTVLTMVFPFGKVNDPASPLALAAGGFIAIRRKAYDAIGGHQAVRHHIVEDVNLARLVKAAGFRIETHLTRDLITTRMYESTTDLWEGLSKNAYAGMDYQPRKFWVGLIVGAAMMVLPPVYLATTLLWVLASLQTKTPTPLGCVAFAISLVMVAAQSAVHLRTTRHMGLPAYHAVLMPLSIAVYLAICCASAFQHHFRGGNVWKGRRVAGVASS